jgi:hypothetical protein
MDWFTVGADSSSRRVVAVSEERTSDGMETIYTGIGGEAFGPLHGRRRPRWSVCWARNSMLDLSMRFCPSL